MADAFIGGLFTLLGVILGAAGTYWNERRRSKDSLEAATIRCLARLEKIRTAKTARDGAKLDEEIWHLGGDLDAYLAAMAPAGKGDDPKYWTGYRLMLPISLTHKLSRLNAAIKHLDRLRGVN